MELDLKTKMTLATQLVSGLLATGHYTQPNPKSQDLLRHMIRRMNPGENWEADGYRCAEPAYVVDDALCLLYELTLVPDSEWVSPLKISEALTPKKKEPIKVAPAKKKKAAPRKKRKKKT